MTKRTMDSRSRERALYQYNSALLRGDFDTVTSILAIAENDAVLTQMILELDQAYEEEQARDLSFEQDKATVGNLLQQHLTASEPVEAEEIPPITVSEVVSRMHADRAVSKADLTVSQQLQNSSIAVPFSPNVRSIKQLASSLGLTLSERFWQAFRETALLLGLRTSQQMGYAAARKQRVKRSGTSNPPAKGSRSDG